MPEDAKVYPDNWCFAMTDRGPVKKLARMDFLGVTVFATSQELKNRIGHIAYILEGLKRLPTIQSYHLQVTWEGQTIEDEFIYGMVTNSTSAGGFKNITGKNVQLDDGTIRIPFIPLRPAACRSKA